MGQGGIVLLSVISLLLILSLLASSAAQQMHWLLQTAAQSTNQGRVQAQQRVLIGALYDLEVGFLNADTDSGVCHWIAPYVCVRFYPQRSSDLVWRFALVQQADNAQNLLVEGWLRRRIGAPYEVAALWFASPPPQ